MKSFMTAVAVAGALAVSIAGASSVFAQAPVIDRPLWDSPDRPFHSAAAGSNLTVIIRKVPNVVFYQLILFRLNASNAYSTRIFSQSEGFVQPTGRNITIQFAVPIPSTEQGHINRIVVKSCTSNNTNSCGNATNEQNFIVLPAAPALYGPAHPTTVAANRVATFSWHHSDMRSPLGGGPVGLPGDYELLLLTRSPEDVGYPWADQETIPYPSINARLGTGSTCPSTPGLSNLNRRCHTMTLPPGVESYIWTIVNCTTYPEKGRRCGPGSSFRSLAAPPLAVSFSANLAPTLRHARCVNCHAVRTDNYQHDSANNPPGGLPSNHPLPPPPPPPNPPPTSWSPALEASGACEGCHFTTGPNSLLPAEGDLNPGWHTPQSTRDFRNKTNEQLCQLAKTVVAPAQNTREHLTEDKLILWALGDGRVPGGTRKLTAPPHSIQGWRLIVAVWEVAGMPCN